jgi:hypothetical protein
MNSRITVCFSLLVMALFPLNIYAQNVPGREGYDYDGKAIVALLPFIGEEEAAARFNESTAQAVGALQKYSPREVSRETVDAAGVRIPTDMPPVRELAPGARFALTGGVYPGNDENQDYLQLWLWDMNSSTMIYTDDLVYLDIDQGLENLPGLVEWLFSHITERTVESEPEEEKEWDDKIINTGIRSGVSGHLYKTPEETAPGAYSLMYEGGVFIAVRLNSLISLQAEANFIWDDLVYRGIDDANQGVPPYVPVSANERRRSFSLLFPLLVKLNFRPGSFRIAPYGGIFAYVPLSKSTYHRYPGGEEDSFSWSAAVPLGFSAGFEVARKLGPGMILADIRYSGDFTDITVHDGGLTPSTQQSGRDTSYKRSMLSVTIGYAFGFIDIKK